MQKIDAVVDGGVPGFQVTAEYLQSVNGRMV